MSWFTKACFLALVVGIQASPRPIGGWRQAAVPDGRPSTVNCTWLTFEQKLDHFGDTPGTFPQRYCRKYKTHGLRPVQCWCRAAGVEGV